MLNGNDPIPVMRRIKAITNLGGHMKLVLMAIAAISLGTASYAGGHNPAEAKGMASFLKGGGGGNNSIAKELLDVADQKGGVARFVSGSKGLLGKGNGGWGNVGSLVTGPDGANVNEAGDGLEFDGQSVSGR